MRHYPPISPPDASAPAHFARHYLQRCHNLHHIQPVYFRKWAEGMHVAR
jgi:hypothetical protein